MVEGSQVDWAAHANDTIGIISEIKVFDDAVGEALNFARNKKNTVVIVASDHGNSGITIGNQDTTENYPSIPLDNFVKYLRKAAITEEQAAKLVESKELSIEQAMAKLGVSDLNSKEIESIKSKTKRSDIQKEMANIVSKRSLIGYTTGGHTGEDVALYVYEPTGRNTLSGTVDNHELPLYAAKVLGINMDDANSKLFVSDKKLEAQGLNVTIDNSDEFNPKLLVKTNSSNYTIQANKNIIDGVDKEFKGITVYNGKNFYIP